MQTQPKWYDEIQIRYVKIKSNQRSFIVNRGSVKFQTKSKSLKNKRNNFKAQSHQTWLKKPKEKSPEKGESW